MQSPYQDNPTQSSRFSENAMALSFDSHLAHQDDLENDSLMGLQELDSHLAIFEESANAGKDPSTATVLQDVATDPFFNAAHTFRHADGDEPKDLESPGFADLPSISPGRALGLPSKSAYAAPLAKAHEHLQHLIHGSVDIKSESTTRSLSESDYQNSAFSSVSSKATSPTDPEFPSKATTSHGSHATSRRKYDVRPRVSIPSDISLQEYARQCIAAAESSRLNPYALHQDENALLRSHITLPQVTTYLNIRNGILRLWTRNPLIGVQRDEAIGCARDSRWFDVANLSFEWLVRRGYINYGCVEKAEIKKSAKPRIPKKKGKTIVVIGAGMSGLGCARQLEGLIAQFHEELCPHGEDPPRVVVLEGRDRIGGRVYSRAFNSAPPSQVPGAKQRNTAEMGGMIVTGFDRGNPLNTIVRGQLALPYQSLRPTTTLHDFDGRPVNIDRDQLVEKLFNDVLDRVSDYKFKVPQAPIVEGEKSLIDAGKDATHESGKLVGEFEMLDLSTIDSDTKSTPDVDLVPVSSDRLTGKSNLEPGVPAAHKAGFKAQLMGWQLKPGIAITHDLDLGVAASAEKATLGSVMDAAIDQYRAVVDLTPQDLRLINWHVANLEYSNATNCRELSLGGWDLDAGNEWEGKHSMIVGGYQQVPRGLLHCPQPLHVERKRIARRIVYDDSNHASKPSVVECTDGTTIEADYIVSTVPLGVLKKRLLLFEPPLPDWKSGAIQRLGFGILNKVILMYDEPFWDQSRDIFGVLRRPPNISSLDQKDYSLRRGRFFQWFNCTKTCGRPCLLALMAGDAAYDTEAMSNDFLVAEATEVLKTIFGTSVPSPVEAIITRWGKDEFAYGSYSYTSPDFQPSDYAEMARPIGNLFFAGEHTCGTHPATVHGAYLSGLRAADEVLEAMLGPIIVPEPLVIPKESANGKRKASEPLSTPKDPKQARLEAYEAEVWAAMVAKLGERPLRPAKVCANPYILYGKDKFDTAKKRCEEGRRPGKGRPAPNEVRIMLSKMWKEASLEERKPYVDKAEEQKREYAAAVKEYMERVGEWDTQGFAFRAVYEKDHPNILRTEKNAEEDSPGRRERRAKRLSGYADEPAPDHL